jgi:hypothetical protein
MPFCQCMEHIQKQKIDFFLFQFEMHEFLTNARTNFSGYENKMK